MNTTYPFEHSGKDYEVRVASNGLTTFVRAFQKDGQPANGYSYSVDLETQQDAAAIGSAFDPVEELVKTAQEDVVSGLWEKYLAAVRASKT